MPKRKTIRQVDTEEVQGEGSFVVISGVKVSEIRRARQLAKEAADSENTEYDSFEAGFEMLRDHIIKWNWVDDDGTPLPQPKEHPEIFDDLTSDEVTYLVKVLNGDEDLKN